MARLRHRKVEQSGWRMSWPEQKQCFEPRRGARACTRDQWTKIPLCCQLRRVGPIFLHVRPLPLIELQSRTLQACIQPSARSRRESKGVHLEDIKADLEKPKKHDKAFGLPTSEASPPITISFIRNIPGCSHLLLKVRKHKVSRILVEYQILWRNWS